MKNRSFISACFALLLAMGYLLSIAGLDVHTCNHTGEVYVSLLSHSLSCEDIHPESEAEECCCCGHHHHQQHDNGSKGCCHDESFQLLFNGDENHSDDACVYAPTLTLHLCPPVLKFSESLFFHNFRSARVICPQRTVPDILSLNCVLRA